MAVFGLVCQLFASQASARLPDSDHCVVTSTCGDCPSEAEDSHCPAEPLHDHCGSVCSHFFTAIFYSAEAFCVRNPQELSLLVSQAELVPEGFPTGLFIPPKAS